MGGSTGSGWLSQFLPMFPQVQETLQQQIHHLLPHSGPMVALGALTMVQMCPLHYLPYFWGGSGQTCITGGMSAILIDLLVASNPPVHCFT